MLKVEKCLSCGQSLAKAKSIKIEKQSVAVLVERPIEVVEYQRHHIRCECCGTITSPQWSNHFFISRETTLKSGHSLFVQTKPSSLLVLAIAYQLLLIAPHSNGLRPKVNTQGENNGFARLTEAQARQIRHLLADGKLTQKTIGSQFNVSRSTIKDIKSGRRWGHLILYQDKRDIAA